MSSGNDLRFSLAHLYELVHANCEQLRASEIVRMQVEARASGKVGGAKLDPEDERYPGAIAQANSLDFQDRYPNGVDIVMVRARVREGLRALRSTLSSKLTSIEVYETLFPVTIHCDELIRTVAGAQSSSWEPLQSEMFDIEDGGQQFFSRLRALLESDNEVHQFVYEAYYYCLSDGFGGSLKGEEERLSEYRNALHRRIDPPLVPAVRPGQGAVGVEAEEVRSPWIYYLGAVLVVLGVLIVLNLLAWYQMGSS